MNVPEIELGLKAEQESERKKNQLLSEAMNGKARQYQKLQVTFFHYKNMFDKLKRRMLPNANVSTESDIQNTHLFDPKATSAFSKAPFRPINAHKDSIFRSNTPLDGSVANQAYQPSRISPHSNNIFTLKPTGSKCFQENSQ
jgi:hypothetical protein